MVKATVSSAAACWCGVSYLVDSSLAKHIRRAQAQADLSGWFQLRFQLLAELLHVCSTHGCMRGCCQCFDKLIRDACLNGFNCEGCFHLHKLHSPFCLSGRTKGGAYAYDWLNSKSQCVIVRLALLYFKGTDCLLDALLALW